MKPTQNISSAAPASSDWRPLAIGGGILQGAENMYKQVDRYDFKKELGIFWDYTFKDCWNKHQTAIVRKIIRRADNKVCGIILNWHKYYLIRN
jgi:ribulose 1,5-bisphosphate synthetase/thiazole synthase